MVWEGWRGRNQGKLETERELKVECDDVAWGKWSVCVIGLRLFWPEVLRALLKYRQASYDIITLNRPRATSLNFFSVQIVCDYLSISLDISLRRFCILRFLIVSVFVQKMAATVTQMAPDGFFPYPGQFVIHYSLMLPMF